MVEQLIWGFLTRAVTSAEGSVSRDLSVVAGAYGSWRPWWVRGLTDFVLICRMGQSLDQRGGQLDDLIRCRDSLVDVVDVEFGRSGVRILGVEIGSAACRERVWQDG